MVFLWWVVRSPSHRQLPYTVDGHQWHGGCHAGGRPAGGAGVQNGPAERRPGNASHKVVPHSDVVYKVVPPLIN